MYKSVIGFPLSVFERSYGDLELDSVDRYTRADFRVNPRDKESGPDRQNKGGSQSQEESTEGGADRLTGDPSHERTSLADEKGD